MNKNHRFHTHTHPIDRHYTYIRGNTNGRQQRQTRRRDSGKNEARARACTTTIPRAAQTADRSAPWDIIPPRTRGHSSSTVHTSCRLLSSRALPEDCVGRNTPTKSEREREREREQRSLLFLCSQPPTSYSVFTACARASFDHAVKIA